MKTPFHSIPFPLLSSPLLSSPLLVPCFFLPLSSSLPLPPHNVLMRLRLHTSVYWSASAHPIVLLDRLHSPQLSCVYPLLHKLNHSCLSVCLSAYLLFYFSVCESVSHVRIQRSVSLSVCLFIRQFVSQSVCVCVVRACPYIYHQKSSFHSVDSSKSHNYNWYSKIKIEKKQYYWRENLWLWPDLIADQHDDDVRLCMVP